MIGEKARISLRDLTPLQWVILVKPALLILGFGLMFASWQLTVFVLLVYGSFKLTLILVLKAAFESIMARELEGRAEGPERT